MLEPLVHAQDPVSMMNPLPPSFVLVCNRGPIAIGRFEMPAFHKEEGENLLSKFGIDIEYGEPIDYGTGTALSDFDRARLIETYVDHAFKVRDTARTLKRSPHTVTRHMRTIDWRSFETDHVHGVDV